MFRINFQLVSKRTHYIGCRYHSNLVNVKEAWEEYAKSRTGKLDKGVACLGLSREGTKKQLINFEFISANHMEGFSVT